MTKTAQPLYCLDSIYIFLRNIYIFNSKLARAIRNKQRIKLFVNYEKRLLGIRKEFKIFLKLNAYRLTNKI